MAPLAVPRLAVPRLAVPGGAWRCLARGGAAWRECERSGRVHCIIGLTERTLRFTAVRYP